MTLQEKINELLNNAIIDAPNFFRTQLTDQIISAFKEMVEERLNELMRNPSQEDDVAIKTLDNLLSSLTEDK